MAQLAAVENALYYPTALRAVQIFREKYLSLYGAQGWVFDPCCGEGDAVKELVKPSSPTAYYKMKTAGVELEELRAQAAAEKLDKAVQGDFESFLIETSPILIFMNPPYDYIGGERAEIIWINAIAPYLQRYRQMILVLPERFVEGGQDEKKLCLALFKNGLQLAKTRPYGGERVGAMRFPDPEYNDFKQYFIVVERPYGQPGLEPNIPIEGVVGEVTKKPHINLEGGNWRTFDIIAKEKTEYRTKLDDRKLMELFGKPKGEIPIIPLQQLREEITAALIAGGMFMGVPVDNTIVRGGIRIKTKRTRVKNTNNVEDIETQQMIAYVSELDMKTGEIETYDSETDEEAFGVRIEAIAKALQIELTNNQETVFVKDRDLERFSKRIEKVHAPKIIEGRQNGLFPTQIEAACTIMRGWEKQKSIFLVGEMGVGKTITSIAAAIGQVVYREPDKQKILILLPSKNDLVKKWKEEIALSCRELTPKIFHVSTIEELQHAFSQTGLTFILIKESMVKRSSGWEQVKLVDTMKTQKCHRCGQVSKLFNTKGELPTKDDEILYCSRCNEKHKQDTRNKQGKGDQTTNIKTYMTKYYAKYRWESNDEKRRAMELVKEQAAAFNNGVYGNKGNAYYPLAKYISKHYQGDYVLVADEAHQYKAGDSARGYAAGHLIVGAYKVLYMTGTFYNGYASSMFFSLFRANEQFQKEWTYDGVLDFVRLYGLEQKSTKTYFSEDKDTWSGYARKPSTTVKEIPGIHPAIIATMLPFTLFMKLKDLDFELPPQKSSTLFLDMPEETNKQLKNYLEKVRQQGIADWKETGSKSLLGSLTWARNGVYDSYPTGDKIYDEDKVKVRFSFPPINPDKMTPKEEAALRIVQHHKRRGFPSIIGYLQADRRPIQTRLIELFRKYGMRLEYMSSSVSDRVAFCTRVYESGADAIISNPQLMREGIDLLMVGATIWFSATDDAVLVNQFNARNHRIGQEHVTYAYYLGYNETYQAEIWKRTAKKVAAMQATQGDVRTGLSALLGDPDLISTVQNHLLDFAHYESDLSLDDFEPLEVMTANTKHIEKEESWYSYKDWAEEKGIEIPVRKRRSAKVPEAQMTLF